MSELTGHYSITLRQHFEDTVLDDVVHRIASTMPDVHIEKLHVRTQDRQNNAVVLSVAFFVFRYLCNWYSLHLDVSHRTGNKVKIDWEYS